MVVPARPVSLGAPFALVVALLAGLGATPAQAQVRGFRLDRYEGPAAGSATFLVERPWTSDARHFAFGLTLEDAERPLVPVTGETGLTPIITRALVGHVDLAAVVADRLLLAASLPVTLRELGSYEKLAGVAPVASPSLGDPRVSAWLRIAGHAETDGASLHLGVDAWAPLSLQATHQGDSSLRVQPHLLLAGAGGVFRYSLDAAFLVRPYASYGPPALGMTAASEARLGLSLGLSLFGDRLVLGPEALAATQVVGVNAFSPAGTSVEVLGGLHWYLADRLQLGVAAGAGFFGAAGTPDLRGVVRLAWAPRQHPDRPEPAESLGETPPEGTPGEAQWTTTVTSMEHPDAGVAAPRPGTPATKPATAVATGTGKPGAPKSTGPTATGTPTTAPRTGTTASGAPTTVATSTQRPPTQEELSHDADGDGLPDFVDRCPYEAETKNGFRDEDGCPEFYLERDSALTQVLARASVAKLSDGAPTSTPGPVPTSAQGAADAGVAATTSTPPPVLDADGDGVPDELDRCPATAEDKDGFEDEDGCPEPDNDGDGIADAKDKCPEVAETVNGFEDEDGCPDVAKDADRDGVADALDRCPFEPASKDSVRTDGCPDVELPTRASLAKLLRDDEEAPPPVEPAAAAQPATAAPEAVSTPAAPPADSDGDGIADAADRCPLSPEDKDGFEDEDGCPEPDNDDDGIADAKDKCPDAAETVNGFEDEDGCPDARPDVDGDGVDYAHDRCPLEPGDASDGCPHLPFPQLAVPAFPNDAPAPKPVAAATTPAPEASPWPSPAPKAPNDFDGDGVPDEADACPASPEDVDGFEDEDGCPEFDNDHDGIPDATDQCPMEAETINGVKDDDGCPDQGKSAVHVTATAVVIDGVVRFKTASATIEKASMPLLLQVAATLKSAASLSVEVQGHTDDVGSAAKNITLSKKRAEAIRAVLIKAGVAPTRLVAAGYGPTRPRASNKTAAGREQNRRVEFLILGESK